MKKGESLALVIAALLTAALLIGIPEGWWSLAATISYVQYFIMAGIVSVLVWGFKGRIDGLLRPRRTESGFQGSASAWETYKKDFLRTIRPTSKTQIDFRVSITLKGEGPFAVDAFSKVATDHRRIILRGPAGGGKSVFLVKLSVAMANSGVLPIFLDLKRWKKEYTAGLNAIQGDAPDIFDKRLDVLLRVSVVDLTLDYHKKLPTDLRKVVFVDGLNEVYGEETIRQIVEVVDEYVRRYVPNASAIVADREVPRAFLGSSWEEAKIGLIDAEEVQQQIDTLGTGTYSRLLQADKELLRTPYFLDSALVNNSPELGSRVTSIENYLVQQLRLNDDELNTLGRVAFEIYRDYQSPTFEADRVKQEVGDQIWQKLTGALKFPVKGLAQFDHQLKHDYLVSRHLARDDRLWDPRSFDAATFESNSYDSLVMVTEQLADEATGDRFLKQVYDWNWSVTVACLTDSGATGQRRHSRELETAILYLIAEKMFDPVYRTAERARTQLKSQFSPDSVAARLRDVKSLRDVYSVDGPASDDAWFLKWKKLFMRYDSPPLQKVEMEQIVGADSVIGWTASNVIKRFRLDATAIGELRGFYIALQDDTNPGKALVRWRIVHALGAFDDSENVKLLLEVLDHDSYFWVSYGAIRSLVEIAAKTNDEELRVEIMGELEQRIKPMKAKVLEEMGQTMFYQNPPRTWRGLCERLLRRVRDSQSGEADKERWARTLEDFNKFCISYGL